MHNTTENKIYAQHNRKQNECTTQIKINATENQINALHNRKQNKYSIFKIFNFFYKTIRYNSNHFQYKKIMLIIFSYAS